MSVIFALLMSIRTRVGCTVLALSHPSLQAGRLRAGDSDGASPSTLSGGRHRCLETIRAKAWESGGAQDLAYFTVFGRADQFIWGMVAFEAYKRSPSRQLGSPLLFLHRFCAPSPTPDHFFDAELGRRLRFWTKPGEPRLFGSTFHGRGPRVRVAHRRLSCPSSIDPAAHRSLPILAGYAQLLDVLEPRRDVDGGDRAAEEVRHRAQWSWRRVVVFAFWHLFPLVTWPARCSLRYVTEFPFFAWRSGYTRSLAIIRRSAAGALSSVVAPASKVAMVISLGDRLTFRRRADRAVSFGWNGAMVYLRSHGASLLGERRPNDRQRPFRYREARLITWRSGRGVATAARGSKSAWSTFVLAVTCLILAVPILIDVLRSPRLRPFGYVAADTFYYLSVARNIVEHGSPSMDGLHPTNGFHPLWQIATSLVYGLCKLVRHRAMRTPCSAWRGAGLPRVHGRRRLDPRPRHRTRARVSPRSLRLAAVRRLRARHPAVSPTRRARRLRRRGSLPGAQRLVRDAAGLRNALLVRQRNGERPRPPGLRGRRVGDAARRRPRRDARASNRRSAAGRPWAGRSPSPLGLARLDHGAFALFPLLLWAVAVVAGGARGGGSRWRRSSRSWRRSRSTPS